MKSFIPGIPAVTAKLQPFADALGLRALPLHIHEIVLAYAFYHTIFLYLSPWVSSRIIPQRYRHFNYKAKLDWNLQCVSMIQSLIISTLSLWVIIYDGDRHSANAVERVWGYWGTAGSVQAFLVGYFLWDLAVTIQNFQHLGIPVLIHASACSAVYLLGFRPVMNYYSCIFALFELSTPFLNIHHFLNQLDLNGSTIQVVNGVILTVTFFLVRIAYGFYMSAQWLGDVWNAWKLIHSDTATIPTIAQPHTLPDNMFSVVTDGLPGWVVTVFVISNLLLNSLNVVWFSMMVRRILKGARREKKTEQKRA